MFPRDRDPAAVAALQALLRADGWHTARAGLRQAEAEGQPLEPAEPDPKRRSARGALATPLTPGRSGPGRGGELRRPGARDRKRPDVRVEPHVRPSRA